MKLKYFELSKKLASHSDHPQHKLGAVIVQGNRIISLGFNKNTTHTRSPHPWGRLHAEVNAIIKSKEDLVGSSIYVYRQRKDGSLARAYPCHYCLTMIKEVGISTIFYSDYDGYKMEKLK